jgi:hypothetical protein
MRERTAMKAGTSSGFPFPASFFMSFTSARMSLRTSCGW